MLKKYMLKLLIASSCLCHTFALADKFPFQETVYSNNCNTTDDALTIFTKPSTNQEYQVSISGGELSSITYDRVDVKEGGGGSKVVLFWNNSLTYFKRVFVTNNTYELYTLQEKEKSYVEDGKLTSNGSRIPIRSSCASNSIAKLNLDAKLTQLVGKTVCIGCPTKAATPSDNAQSAAEMQRNASIDAALSSIQNTIDKYEAAVAKNDYLKACELAKQAVMQLHLKHEKNQEVVSYLRQKQTENCAIADSLNPPSISCYDLGKARDQCSTSGNYGQCLSVKMDKIFNGRDVPWSSYEIGQGVDSLYRQKCMK